jgi:hypothetical protein
MHKQKYLTYLIVLSLAGSVFGKFDLTLKSHFGYTFVDLEEKLGMPMYSKGATVNYEHIANWDYFSYRIGAETPLLSKNTWSLSGEVGFYRWYFWSYRWRHYSTDSYTYHWRTVKAAHYGLLLKYPLKNRFTLNSGVGLHTMLAGQGTFFAFTFGVSKNINLFSEFLLPLEIRIDLIPAEVPFFSINGGFGIPLRF